MAERPIHTEQIAGTEYGCQDVQADGTEYALATGTPCHDCAPGLLDTYYVTLADLAGDWAGYNGKHTVSWYDSLPADPSDACEWSDSGDVNGNVFLRYDGAVSKWDVLLKTAVSCTKRWDEDGVTAPCDPTANTMSELSCGDAGCDDTDSCEDSAGATCVVSTS